MMNNESTNRDLVLTKRIQNRIQWDRRISNADVHVLSRSGHVTLIGKVESLAKRSAAAEVVKQTKGVVAVVNQLEVPSFFIRRDEEIKNLITHRISEIDFMEKESISVEVKGGRVKLEGMVLNKSKKAQAAGLVWALSGVRDCQNLIKLEDKIKGSESVEVATHKDISPKMIYLENKNQDVYPVTAFAL